MKLKIVILLILFLAVTGFTKGLNSNASYIKEKFPSDYEATIKKHALEKWNDDYSMVVYEINKQSEALIELIKVFESENTNIALKAIQKWGIEGYKDHNLKEIKIMKTFGLNYLLKLHCDWSMVKYEYDKQVKAKDAF